MTLGVTEFILMSA